MVMRMKTTILIKNALRAMIFPHKVFREIKTDDEINYKAVIPLMMLWGFLYIQLHYLIAHGEPLPPALGLAGKIILMAVISILSLILWLFGSLAFYFIARLFKREAKLQPIEVGVFYIWMVYAIMPLLDFPHFFGWKLSYFQFAGVKTCVHFSLIPGFILLFIQSFFLLKDHLKLRGMLGIPAVLTALFIPFFGKFFFVQSPLILCQTFKLGRLWLARCNVFSSVVVAIVMPIFLLLIRRSIIKSCGRRDLCLVRKDCS